VVFATGVVVVLGLGVVVGGVVLVGAGVVLVIKRVVDVGGGITIRRHIGLTKLAEFTPHALPAGTDLLYPFRHFHEQVESASQQ